MPRYAAVDIGSNSIRMQAAETGPGMATKILAAERQVTRLGAGVFHDGRITADAMEFVCANLERMAQIYQKLDVIGVRAVATSAVRDASNQQEFLERAAKALGSPVEIISGQEEARLIHLGVLARWPQTGKRVLMIDVGGGSAEVILSEHGVLAEAFSKPLGAVRLTEVFLRTDPPAPIDLHRMNEYIDEKLVAPLRKIGAGPFDRAIATSATAAAIVCAVNRVTRARRDEADRLKASVAQIRQILSRACNAGRERPAQDSGHRAEPRRADRGGHRRLPAIAGAVQAARHALFGGGRAGRHHRGPGRARRGPGAEHAESRSAPRGGADGAPLRSAALARAQGGGAGASAVPSPCSRCTGCRRAWASCWKRPPICTISGTTSATPAITSIPTIWWPIPICPASPTPSAR